MNFKTTLFIALTSVAVSSCSIFSFGDSSEDKQKLNDPKLLCTSKADIIANHTYISSLKACKELSEKGDLEATYVLGMLYTDTSILTSLLEPETRVKEGISYVKKSADGGVIPAQLSLANYYADVEGNNEAAIEYFQKAIDGGNKEAYADIAVTYESMGMCKEAVKYYLLDAKALGPKTQSYFYLTRIYAEGCSDLQANMNTACGYYEILKESPYSYAIMNTVLEYEVKAGIAGNPKTITDVMKRVHNYDASNSKKCAVTKNNLTSK